MGMDVRSIANGHRLDLRERGTGELVKKLSSQVSTLVHQEIELAKTEMAEKGRKAGLGAGLFGGAGVAGLLTLGSLTAFLIIVLALAIPAWASALLVTLLWGAIAGVLALQGRNKLREVGRSVPEKTIETVKEDLQWLKHRK
jgi:uncharacterized membrane protein YqjE